MKMNGLFLLTVGLLLWSSHSFVGVGIVVGLCSDREYLSVKLELPLRNDQI
jgi:hypothetical protein